MPTDEKAGRAGVREGSQDGQGEGNWMGREGKSNRGLKGSQHTLFIIWQKMWH